MAALRNTTHGLVQNVANGNVAPAEIPRALSTIFDARDYKSSIEQLQEPVLRLWVERLDQVSWFRTPPWLPHKSSSTRSLIPRFTTSSSGKGPYVP